MATRKPRRAGTAPSVASKATATADPADPNSWLFLNPAGPSAAGTTFGVLRKSYGGRNNTASEFGWRKAHVGRAFMGKDRSTWSPNVERVEVILPSGAEDGLADPSALLAAMDASAIEREKALLVSITVPLGDVDRIHVGWERARSFARRFADERRLASILVLHAPGLIGEPFPLHAHVLLIPRVLTGLGLRHGCYDQELVHDGGQAIVEAMWAAQLIEKP